MMRKSRVQFFVGVLLFYLFTQIQWANIFFPMKKMEEVEIDNSALFYTESEAAMKTEFFMKQE